MAGNWAWLLLGTLCDYIMQGEFNLTELNQYCIDDIRLYTHGAVCHLLAYCSEHGVGLENRAGCSDRARRSSFASIEPTEVLL